MDNQGLFLKSGHFFRFLKRPGETTPPPPSCTPVSVVEYASISLNMSKYSWKFLNKLCWLCLSSEYTLSPCMFGKLLKMHRVLNKPWLWIWHGCICKGYAEFRICLIMAPCISIMPEYALMFLNMPEYDWILMSLNMSEHSWLNCSDYARVLNMPRYSYNIIITVTNVIILELLSTRFVHPGSLLPFYLF